MASIIRLFKPRELLVMGLFSISLISVSILLYTVSMSNRQTSLENQGYVRYTACVIDVRNEAQSVTVSVDTLDKCWVLAEQQTGVKLPRYHELIKN